MARPLFSHATVFGEGGFIIAAQAITATGTITNGDEIIPVDATAGVVTVTLPFAATRRGRQIYFVKVDAVNNVTVQRAGADVIGYAGVANVMLTTQDQVLHLVADGSTRWIRLQG